MSARLCPLMGRAVERVSITHYGAFYAGHYRGERNVWLALAKNADDPRMRKMRAEFAITAHRSMMRCLREARREMRALEAA
jgi:hypothetical protein